MSHIARQFFQIPVTIVANTCESGLVEMKHFVGGLIHMSPDWDTAHVGVKVGILPTNMSFSPLCDKFNAIAKVEHPTPAFAYPLPDEIFGAQYFRLWSVSASNTGLNQTVDRLITLSLKG